MTTPRPSLTERRKAATLNEIALAAARLFAEHGAEGAEGTPDAAGAEGITAEEIARASGVSLRTFYRYFRTKEDAVAPLLANGVRHWLDELADGPRELPVPQALERSARIALTAAPGRPAVALDLVRGILRTARHDPDLLAVWHRVHHDSELELARVLADLAGTDADPLELRLVAAAANTGMRVAMESWAASEAPPGEAAGLAARCISELTAGLRLWTD
ncbi:TetR/AcrR family transcriptional regulator [Saccharothrix sp. ST-888]|uniref:TetR/AcrR family transcriptional regulator n=1 Tax=Saccharothrix sp. ST-888 TaxID=1427391 RepID=UPI0005EC32C6|nr:TetR family transcriptional regulator [Saccharothrix sp. ST-888]KJK59997.1 TetR family transcriptional regulator [Saccharothrix sp. ST-888]